MAGFEYQIVPLLGTQIDDDLWDWERGEVSTLGRRLLSEEELQEFSDNVTGEIRYVSGVVQ